MSVDQHSVPSGIRTCYDAIIRQIETLREMSERSDEDLARRSEAVSQWSILFHLDHLGMVNAYIANGIATALEKPPRNLDVKLSMIGRIILLTGFIPRGKGKRLKRSCPPLKFLLPRCEIGSRRPRASFQDWRRGCPSSRAARGSFSIPCSADSQRLNGSSSCELITRTISRSSATSSGRLEPSAHLGTATRLRSLLAVALQKCAPRSAEEDFRLDLTPCR